MGAAEEETIAANITLDEEYDVELQKKPILKFSTESIEIGDRKIDCGNEIFDFDKGININGNLSSSGVISGTGIVVNGSQLICGTVIRNIQTDPLPSTGVLTISTPGINQTMPAAACNGDGDAAVFTIGTVTIVPSGECISIPLSNVDMTTIRINYSYWKQL